MELHIHQLRTGQLSESFIDREKYQILEDQMDEEDDDGEESITNGSGDNEDKENNEHKYSMIGRGMAITPLWAAFVHRNQSINNNIIILFFLFINKYIAFRRHRFEVPFEQLKGIVLDIFNSKILKEDLENERVKEIEPQDRILFIIYLYLILLNNRFKSIRRIE